MHFQGIKMQSRRFVFVLCGAWLIHQVFSQCDPKDLVTPYSTEMMVESNVTLNGSKILTALGSLDWFQVNDSKGKLDCITIVKSELVAECMLIGSESNCNCSEGFVWSNEVCYNFNCCRESTCYQNVSYEPSICIAKVPVDIKGTVTLNNGTWNSNKTQQLIALFEKLNAFVELKIISLRKDDTIADFEASLGAIFETLQLQNLLTSLKDFFIEVQLNTLGVVTIESPNTTVCYMSEVNLTCGLKETSDSAAWYLYKNSTRSVLKTGTVVALQSCTTEIYKSCLVITLREVTNLWAGKYECEFVSGSVRHKAEALLNVSLLPDKITITAKPQTVKCTGKSSGTVNVNVTATIPYSTENYKVTFSYQGAVNGSPKYKSQTGNDLNYVGMANISCIYTPEARNIITSFTNNRNQTKIAEVVIPVIFNGRDFCKGETINDVVWPDTPAKDTVISNLCEAGRVGYKSRTCEGSTWQPVFDHCIKKELDIVLTTAKGLEMGLEATPEKAYSIFEGLHNVSVMDAGSNETSGDLVASVYVLQIMSNVSNNIQLQENIVPVFVDATNSILNEDWNGLNTSFKEDLSAEYLESIEKLVKNINISTATKYSRQNIELQTCLKFHCNMSVFDMDVTVKSKSEIIKTFAVKNLTDKLKKNFQNAAPSSLLISTTLVHGNSSTIKTTMDFPLGKQGSSEPFCVFWNNSAREWSREGCEVQTSLDNKTTCICTHLTSFSALMSKTKIDLPFLNEITYVGMGVSICSLLLFLIVEYLVWSAVVKSNLSHFRHTALVNIAFCLLLADCSFLASAFPKSLSETWCLSFTICKHFFFLAMFGWMLSLSVMLVHQLIFVFSPLRKRVFMLFSSILGYVCPFIIVGVSYMYYRYTKTPYYNPDACWLIYEQLMKGSIHAFLLPVGIVVLVNLFSMVVVILTLLKSSIPGGSSGNDKETAKSILKVVIFLTPVFGVTWIFGFFQLIFDKSDIYPVFFYCFTILNSFQGLFIFLTGCFAEQKVREELFKLIVKRDQMNQLTSTKCEKDQ